MLNDPEHDPERHIYLDILELLMSSTQVVLDLEKTMIKQPELFVNTEASHVAAFLKRGNIHRELPDVQVHVRKYCKTKRKEVQAERPDI